MVIFNARFAKAVSPLAVSSLMYLLIAAGIPPHPTAKISE